MRNVDYVLVGRFGALVPRRLQRVLGVSISDALVCVRIGRRGTTTRMERDRAMRFAWLFWLLIMGAALTAFVVSMVTIGQLFGHETMGTLAAAIPLAFLGLLVFAAWSNIVTFIRSGKLDNVAVGQSRGTVQDEGAPAASVPKPYDSWIGMVLAVVAFLGSLAAVGGI